MLLLIFYVFLKGNTCLLLFYYVIVSFENKKCRNYIFAQSFLINEWVGPVTEWVGLGPVGPPITPRLVMTITFRSFNLIWALRHVQNVTVIAVWTCCCVRHRAFACRCWDTERCSWSSWPAIMSHIIWRDLKNPREDPEYGQHWRGD